MRSSANWPTRAKTRLISVLIVFAVALSIASICLNDWVSGPVRLEHHELRIHAGLWRVCDETRCSSLHRFHEFLGYSDSLNTMLNKIYAVRVFAITSTFFGVVAVALTFGTGKGGPSRLAFTVASWLVLLSAFSAMIGASLYSSVIHYKTVRLDIGFFLFALSVLIFACGSIIMDLNSPASHLRRKVAVVCIAVLVFCLPILGGLFNRMRGGWMHFSQLDNSLLTHDALARLLMAGTSGFLVGLCTLSLKRSLPLALVYTILTFFSLFVGWGCYFSIGRGNHWANTRAGVFDWLVGRQEAENWSFHRRWLRDIAAMSLRGALWTSPSGLILFFLGYGALPLFSGLAMGLWYDIAWTTPSTIHRVKGPGTPVAEFMWGYWLWYCIVISFVVVHLDRLERRTESTALSASFRSSLSLCTAARLKSFGLIFVHVYAVVLEILFVVSIVSYYPVMTRAQDIHSSAVRNREQTLLGLCVATVGMIIVHALWALRPIRRWLSASSQRHGLDDLSSYTLQDSSVFRMSESHADDSSVNKDDISSSSSSSSDDDSVIGGGLSFRNWDSPDLRTPLTPHLSPGRPVRSRRRRTLRMRAISSLKRDLRRVAPVFRLLYYSTLVACCLWCVVWLLLTLIAVGRNKHYFGCTAAPNEMYCDEA